MSKVWYGSLQNRLIEAGIDKTEIKPGDAMTAILYSDRHVWYVDLVKSDKKGIKEIHLIRPKVYAKDYFAGDWVVQSYEDAKLNKPFVRPDDGYTYNYQNQTTVVFRTRRGTFTQSGKVDDTVFRLGDWGEYEDPNF